MSELPALRPGTAPAGPAMPTALAPAFADIARLKRLPAQQGDRSLAGARYRLAWARLAGGDDPDAVAATEIAAAAAEAALGGVDAGELSAAGVPLADRRLIFHRAAARTIGDADALAGALDSLADGVARDDGPVPPFAEALADQPRRRSRYAADDADDERLGEHAWTVAVFAGLLELARQRPPGDAFLLGLVHQGGQEVLLERDLSPPLAMRCRAVLAEAGQTGTALGAAFTAAHVVERVLQERHHANLAGFSLFDAVSASDLIPPGPLQAYELAVVRQMGLAF